MDEVFGPPAMAILTGDTAALAELLAADPSLASRRSTVGHPTLLQLVACEASALPNPVEVARVLVEAGAEVAGPLVAAAGCGSKDVLDHLLDTGADIDGDGRWTPLDEALYWANLDIAASLIDRGARIRALSTAAGLGDTLAIDRFFEADELTDDAGPIGSPFADTVPTSLADDPQSIIDHAFVMAVNAGHHDASAALVARGASVNARPPGYHWGGTALHAAVWRGDRELVTWLLSIGADPTIKDGLADSDAAGWADHHGHDHLLDLFPPTSPHPA